MIEGLRVFPAYQDARHQPTPSAPPIGATCEECKRNVPAIVRQDMGCGYEPAIESPRSVWSPASWAARGWSATTCPGYTAALPCVVEVVGAHAQWQAGSLVDYLDGERPTAPALDALAWLDGAIELHKADVAAERLKKGGA